MSVCRCATAACTLARSECTIASSRSSVLCLCCLLSGSFLPSSLQLELGPGLNYFLLFQFSSFPVSPPPSLWSLSGSPPFQSQFHSFHAVQQQQQHQQHHYRCHRHRQRLHQQPSFPIDSSRLSLRLPVIQLVVRPTIKKARIGNGHAKQNKTLSGSDRSIDPRSGRPNARTTKRPTSLLRLPASLPAWPPTDPTIFRLHTRRRWCTNEHQPGRWRRRRQPATLLRSHPAGQDQQYYRPGN